jgi:hypothetical protein
MLVWESQAIQRHLASLYDMPALLTTKMGDPHVSWADGTLPMRGRFLSTDSVENRGLAVQSGKSFSANTYSIKDQVHVEANYIHCLFTKVPFTRLISPFCCWYQ